MVEQSNLRHPLEPRGMAVADLGTHWGLTLLGLLIARILRLRCASAKRSNRTG